MLYYRRCLLPCRRMLHGLRVEVVVLRTVSTGRRIHTKTTRGQQCQHPFDFSPPPRYCPDTAGHARYQPKNSTKHSLHQGIHRSSSPDTSLVKNVDGGVP